MRTCLLGLLIYMCITPIIGQTAAILIEDFDSGAVQLTSWADEDIQPDAWSLDTVNTHAGSAYALKLSGNTWKEQQISPLPTQLNTVIELAAYHSTGATVQGIGFSDGANQLFYSFSGSRILDLEVWVPVYQGAFSANSWNLYRLPLGADWESFFGYFPSITSLIYVNDLDQSSTRNIWFDSIYDITPTLPVAPEVIINAQIPSSHINRFVGIQFSATINDPDSEAFTYSWSFGDGNHSSQSSPYHIYDIADAHQYTVNLVVTDESGKQGYAATRVSLDEGSSTLPLTMNFVGDVMLARRYDTQIIPQQGIQTIFQPTLTMLGEAADVTIANLEVVLANTGTPHPTKSVVYRGNPNNITGLIYAGIDNVSLANNHTLDYGLPALRQTQSLLEANGIAHSGAGADSYEAYLPSIIHQKGISIALLRSSDRTGQYNNAQPYLQAGFAKEGFAYMTPYYNMMQLAAVQNIADLKVVEMHAGSEYSTAPGADYGKSDPYLEEDQDEDYSFRYDVPHQWDREIRHSAVDNGADLVIVHHPHIVHGVELYNGKVIAHSLGNFAFDLDYPECMNSVIFYVDAHPDGFKNHHLRPVYIDNYIPKPASGQLGIHILDYIAMKSRELDTIVVVDKDELKAYIPTQPDALIQATHSFEYKLAFDQYDDDYQKTSPQKLPRYGSLSSVDHPGPAEDVQLRLGTEQIWFGNFEDEGSSLWEVTNFSESAVDGARSAYFFSDTGASQNASFAKKMKLHDNQKSYTLHGWIRTRNAQSASITIRYYNARTSGYPVGYQDITVSSGTEPWKWYYLELSVPANALFYDLRLNFSGIPGEMSHAWFDNVGLIEWENWNPVGQMAQIPHPNNFYWFQLRTQEGIKSLSCSLTETAFSEAGRPQSRTPQISRLPLKIYPNPFNPETNISFDLSKAGKTSVKIYNLKGQLVHKLLDEELPPGKHQTVWNGKDIHGKTVASGLYLIRIISGNMTSTRKAILMK